MKAMAFSALATWVWDCSKNNMIEDYFEFKGKLKEFAEMNGDCTIDLFQMGIIWHLNGLGDDHTVFCNTIMTSEAVLDEHYILGKMRDYMQMNRSRETGQRALQNPKYFTCHGFGHMANDCPNNQKDSSSDEPKKKRSQPRKSPKLGDQNSHSIKQKACAAEDEPPEKSDSNEDGDEFSTLAVEEEPPAVESASLIQEKAHRVDGDLTRWCFDSGATSISTGD